MNGEWFWEEFKTSEGGMRWRYRDHNQFNKNSSWLFVQETSRGWMWWNNAMRKHYLLEVENIEEAKAVALIEWRMR